MRNNLKQVGATEKAFLPLWMRTAQAGSIAPSIYIAMIPLVYL